MSDILIFGGTTEGRELADFCAANGISADVSAATEYGARLLPEAVGILTGKRSAEQIAALLRERRYALVIDATHPYAEEASDNIRTACQQEQIPCRRLLRNALPVTGESVRSLEEMTALLNQTDDTILSTLGSKSVAALTKVTHFRARIWLRLLPSETAAEECGRLGFDPQKLILEKGPFDTAQNLAHIVQTGAKILLTKESGTVGGYPEKAEAAKQCGIRMITLCRPPEPLSGYNEDEIKQHLLNMKEKNLL